MLKLTLLILFVGLGSCRIASWIRWSRRPAITYRHWPVQLHKQWMGMRRLKSYLNNGYLTSKSGYCPDIKNFLNGKVVYDGKSVGDSATLSCNENYTHCGQKDTVCKNDFKWNNPNTLCLPYCVSDNFTFTHGNSRYFISGSKRSFNDSQDFCKSLQGSLVMINSREEQDLMRCVLDTLNNNDIPSVKCNTDRQYVWHGIVKTNGYWKFINGDNITNSFWGSDDPDSGEFCGVLKRSGSYRWWSEGGNCDKSFAYFICEIDA